MSERPEPILEFHRVSKIYGEIQAVEELSFSIHRGEIFALLGPNGSGKTTTILMLLGLVSPTSGSITICGTPLQGSDPALRLLTGVVMEQQSLYPDLSAAEYLRLFGRLYQVPELERRIDAVLEMVGLSERKDQAVGGYSRGMALKLGLARALLHDPEILILDEPVEGLDPMGIREVRNLLLAARQNGKTVLLSSHILSEVEAVADRVGILSHGKLLALGAPRSFRNRLQPETELVVEVDGNTAALTPQLQALPFVINVTVSGNFLQVKVASENDYRAELARAIARGGAVAVNIAERKLSLEEAFVTITSENVAVIAAPDHIQLTAPAETVPRLQVKREAFAKWNPTHITRVLSTQQLKSLLASPSVYWIMALTAFAAALLTNSYLSYIDRNQLIVLPRPWVVPFTIGSALISVYLGISAALAAAQERTSGTLQVLFFGPVNEAVYLFSLFLSRTALYILWAIVNLGVMLFLARAAGFGFQSNFVPAGLYGLLPCLQFVAFGLLLGSGIRSVRGVVGAFIALAAGLLGIQAVAQTLNQLVAAQRYSSLAIAREALNRIDLFIGWLSPFRYLSRGLQASLPGEFAQLILFGGLVVIILFTGAVWMMRKRTVLP